jgi:hypothetical protein
MSTDRIETVDPQQPEGAVGEPEGCPTQATDSEAPPQPRGLKAWLKHAFAIEKNDESSLSADDKAVLLRMAERIHERRMGSAAILWLQGNRHLNFLGSQAMVAAEPMFEMTHPLVNGVLRFLGLNIPPEDYPLLIAAFEKRYSIEYLIQLLEARL